MPSLAQHIDALTEVLERIERPFVWAASARVTGEIVLAFDDGTRVRLTPRTPGETRAALTTLRKRAKPAAFGDGNETKVDASVRDGACIRAKDAGLSLEGFDPATNGVLEAARQTLMPNATAPLRAELYALNLYETGGHFAAHKDTPRGADMVGTLVACLPFSFEGGTLVLDQEERRVTLRWADEVSDNHLPCAAFFGDVDHAVQEVTSGSRVTLSFLVYRSPAKKSAKVAPKKSATPKADALEANLMKALTKVAADADVAAHGGVLRFPCVHQYPVSPKTPPLVALKRAADTESLAGRDGVVARAALAAGLDVSLAYYLSVRDESGWMHSDEGNAMEVRLDAPPTPKMLAKLRRIMERASDSEAIESWAGSADARPSFVIGSDPGAALHLGRGLTSSTGYYGNEASEADYYVGASIDVVLPRRGALPTQRNVSHAKFGRGVVVGTSGEGDERKVRVRFESGEEKTLLERFVTFGR